jgi:mannosyl-3-phosphoglycerate phosphatase family protein
MLKPLIITDLDGTLLDLRTYSPQEAHPALIKLRRKQIPVIFLTSKTKAEVEFYRTVLPISDSPFGIENGAALYLPNTFPAPEGSQDGGENYKIVVWGQPYPEMIKQLHNIASETKIKLMGLAALTEGEISSLTGLDIQQASLAKKRQFTEPFFFAEGDIPERVQKVKAAAAKRGLYCERGNRFYHLMGRHDKGTAVVFLRHYFAHYIPPYSWYIIAIGDAPNDIPMLRKADKGYLVHNLNDTEVNNIPNLYRTKASGPAGWAEVVEQVLKE